MEAAAARALNVPKTLQRARNGKSKQRATPMSFEEMVEMVKIMEKEDYDSRLATNEKLNLRKDMILEKVIDVLQQNFAVQRTKDQLRKRWSDLKLREQDQLKRILKVIKIRREKNKKVQNVIAQADPHTQSQHVGDDAEGRDQDDASLFLGCDVPETPEISSSDPSTRPCTRRTEAAMHVSETLQRERNWQTKQKATPMSFEEMVVMVKIMEKEDYDSRLAIYEKPNLRKDVILEKVIDVLQQNFAVQRTKDQLRKRWSDLKLREEDQLKRILKVIKIRREKNKIVQNVIAQADPHTQSQHVGDVAEGRDQDDASLFLGCDVPETPEISSSVQITDPRPDASTISSIVSDLMRCRRDIEGMQKQLAEMQGTLTNVLEVLTKF